MNKRIRELAWENGCRARKFTKGVAIYPNVDEDLERFALAIIRECANICDQQGRVGWNDDRKAQARLDRDLINQHFSVIDPRGITVAMLDNTIAHCEHQLAENRKQSGVEE